MVETMLPAVVETTTVAPPAPIRLPKLSLRVTLISDVEEPSAVIEVGVATTVAVLADGVPGTKLTLAVAVAAVPPTVKEIVAVPDNVAAVSVAAYVPSPLSVTMPRLPRLVAIVTDVPPVVTRLPLASRRVTVTVDWAAPSAVNDVGEADICEVPGLGAPATKPTVPVAVEAFPPTVKVMVAVPTVTPEVRVAV